MKQVEKKWYKKIDFSMIILLILFIFVLACFVQIEVLNYEYIDIMGYSFFRVISGSMSPTIEVEDIVIVKLNADVNEGDIITYKSGDNFITHRIIEMNDNEILTQGDANNAIDKAITKDDVIGKVVFTINHVAVWLNVIKTPIVIITLIVSIIIIKLLFFRKKEQRN